MLLNGPERFSARFSNNLMLLIKTIYLEAPGSAVFPGVKMLLEAWNQPASFILMLFIPSDEFSPLIR